MAAETELARVLQAVSPGGRRRLMTMGWVDVDGDRLRLLDPERDVRRAVGGPVDVSLIDLELDPERWHGHFVTTIGNISWQESRFHTAALGRVWVDRSIELLRRRKGLPLPTGTRVRVTGILFADRDVRALHRLHCGESGGYGQGGIYVAQFSALSIRLALEQLGSA
ncbi:MAG TPA: hypothetical protein PKE31_14965 [Pseudomonadota bacterium]|nr:hypothetical protein [Pseudomonadota bacterium]